jgi:hypothetical protein
VRESAFKRVVRKDLKSLFKCWNVKIAVCGKNGTPDILMCLNSYFVALELKASKSAKRSELQKLRIKEITEAGGYAYFVYPEIWKQVYKELQKLSLH